jgi:hypothetical protein
LGRGKKRKTWDFARIKVVNQSGSRNEEWQRMKPFCKADFVDFYVNKAPSYRSFLAIFSSISRTVG